jgi:GNAT superfamily N-acetyltransferase
VIGSERWSRDAERWLKETVWIADPGDRGETILFFDNATHELVGYVTWRFRREAVLEGETKRWSVQIHFMGVAEDRQGEGIGPVMLETALEDAIKAMERRSGKKRAKGPMPTLIDAEVENVRARWVYKENWGFEHRRYRPSADGREYEEMWRPPPEPIKDAPADPKEAPAE